MMLRRNSFRQDHRQVSAGARRAGGSLAGLCLVLILGCEPPPGDIGEASTSTPTPVGQPRATSSAGAMSTAALPSRPPAPDGEQIQPGQAIPPAFAHHLELLELPVPTMPQVAGTSTQEPAPPTSTAAMVEPPAPSGPLSP